jgi:hypothetical protein
MIVDSIVTFLRCFLVSSGRCISRNVEYQDENRQAWTSYGVGLITGGSGILSSSVS